MCLDTSNDNGPPRRPVLPQMATVAHGVEKVSHVAVSLSKIPAKCQNHGLKRRKNIRKQSKERIKLYLITSG